MEPPVKNEKIEVGILDHEENDHRLRTRKLPTESVAISEFQNRTWSIFSCNLPTL